MRSGRGRSSGHATARGLVIGALTVSLMAVATPAPACSPADEVTFAEVVAAPARDASPGYRTYLGVVEQRVVASAPPVPMLTTRRSVTTTVRTWGVVETVDVPDQRFAEYLEVPLRLLSFCPAHPQPRLGDSTLSVVHEQQDGRSTWTWLVPEPYRFDPTFADGLSASQVDALTSRFGVATEVPPPSRGQLIGWWLWAWMPWLAILGSTGVAAFVAYRSTRNATAGSGTPG